MKGSCAIKNYSKDFSGKINFTLEEVSNIKNLEDIKTLIELKLRSFLDNNDFSLSYENSKDPINYDESIIQLALRVNENLSKLHIPEYKPEYVIDFIILKYSRLLTDNEEEIKKVLPNVEISSIEVMDSISYKDEIESIFGDYYAVNEHRLNIFRNRMRTLLIIDPINQVIIDNVEDINESIISYLESLFDFIKKYLNKVGFNTDDINIFRTNEYGYKEFDNKYIDVMLMMFHYLKSIEDLQSFVNLSWMNNATTNGDLGALFHATNSFLNIMYFDNILSETLGDYIHINKKLSSPIIVKEALGELKVKYKYTINTKDKFKLKNNWDDSIKDGIASMGKFLKVLVSSIPLRSYNNPEDIYRNMEPKDFMFSIGMLFLASYKLSYVANREPYINALLNHRTNMLQSLKTMLGILFKRDSLSNSLIKELTDIGLDINIFNNLFSIYTTLFKGIGDQASWDSIELEYIKEKGYDPDRIPIVDTLLGVSDSNVYMLYLQTTYDKDNLRAETKIKSRIASDSSKFDIINSINDSTIDRSNKLEILTDYKIKLSDDGITYEIDLDGIPLKVKAFGQNILKKRKSLVFLTKEFDNLFKNENNSIPDLTSSATKERLFRGETNSGYEERFMKVLKFIDAMLGTDFTYSVDGLTKLLYLLSTGSKINNLKLMMSSAVRALVITDIYNLFENAKTKDGDPYIINLIKKFITDSDVFKSKAIVDLTGKDAREYFFINSTGEHLSVVKSGDSWIDELAKVNAIMSGNSSVSVIPDLLGNKIPLISLSYLGALIWDELNSLRESDSASSNLLFVNNPKAIVNLVVNTDISTESGNKKSVKLASLPELLYDLIINKFIIPYTLDNRKIFVLPTVYSDKTKFILYQILLGNDLGVDIGSSEDTIIDKILNTIGKSYEMVWLNVLEDYQKIFPEYTDLDLILSWLKEHTELEFIDRASKVNVSVYRDTHYRNLNKNNLSINEILYDYANNLYTELNLRNRLQKEKKEFAKILYKNRFTLNIALTEDNKMDTTDSVTLMFDTLECGKLWLVGDRIVLAKAKDKNGNIRNILYGEISDEEEIILNPILDKFFLLDNLLGNNLRLSLTGSEINHKIKTLQNFSEAELEKYKDFISEHSSVYKNSNNKSITFYEIELAIKNSLDLFLSDEDSKLLKELEKLYSDTIYTTENAAQSALFKRNVIIPGTMRYYFLNTLYGIRDKMNIAVIDDIGASVFNFSGEIDKVDAHDGSALIDPLTSILENMSLLDSAVGTVKKPIHHWYDDRYMTATLLKYAVDTITNKWMRQSEGNTLGIKLRDIFKKMTNKLWDILIDLFRCDYLNKNIKNFDFSKDILKGKLLFYREDGKHHSIVNFGIENGVYYTLERIVNSYGTFSSSSEDSKLVKYYHKFDNKGTHYKSTSITDTPNLHTINSLFELHTALGGIYSESLNDDGKLDYSEISNYIVVNWMNYVSTKKKGAKNDLTLSNYYQPLKHYMINMVANNSAIKNGAGNVNPTSRFYNDIDLRYITVGTKNYGILMDADHEADEGMMTEFSLVISSLDAGGRLHEYVSEIYEMLGTIAIDLSKVELDAMESFITTKNKTALYITIGKTILNNLRKDKSAGLALTILDNVKLEFNLHSDLNLANIFIPFSDPNIYSTILSTFVSTINGKSIKRLYPGLGTVMVPAYDISMIYDIDGATYLYEDILKIAIESALNMNYVSSYKDLALKNRDIVNWYLSLILDLLNFIDIDLVLPTDNLMVYIDNFDVSKLNLDLVDYEIYDRISKDGLFKNKAIRIFIKGLKDKGTFDLVKDTEEGYYSVHFKTGNPDTGETYGSTPEERRILYNELYKLIPNGAYVSTWGNVSKGGLMALDKLMKQDDVGFLNNKGKTEYVEDRIVLDREGNELAIPIYKKSGTYSREFPIVLNKVEDYYSFIENPMAFLSSKGVSGIYNFKLKRNVKSPRNLAPAKISWLIVTGLNPETQEDIISNMNIFTHWRVKKLFKGLAFIRDNNIEAINTHFGRGFEDKSMAERFLRKECNVLKAFDELDKGLYIDESGKQYNIYNLENKAAEMITSNLFKTRFGIKEGDSLADIRILKDKYFRLEYEKPKVSNYDLEYTSRDRENLYISFNPVPIVNETIKYRKLNWDNTILLPMKKESGNIVDRIVYTDKLNIPLFEVGRRIIRNYIEYRDGKFIDTRTEKEVKHPENFNVYKNNLVVERVYYVLKYNVRENLDSHTLITLSHKKLEEVFNPTKEGLSKAEIYSEVSNYLGKILSDIYHYKDFSGITINTVLSSLSRGDLYIALKSLGYQFRYDVGLLTYVNELSKLVDESKINKEGNYKLSNISFLKLFREYQDYLARLRYTSFLKSLYFTASRIPAQTLLSFMLMKNVGYTGVNNNLCFVSHW